MQLGQVRELKTWHVTVGTIVVLGLYRHFSPELRAPASVILPWLTWLPLVGMFLIRSLAARSRAYPQRHHLARSAAGAAVLVALATASATAYSDGRLLSVALLLGGSLSLLALSGLRLLLSQSTVGLVATGGDGSIGTADLFLPHGFGAVISRDLKILRFAVWPEGGQGLASQSEILVFSNHFVARPMLIALLCLALVELAVGHLLVRLMAPQLALLHAALGVLFALYVLGITRSLVRLPTSINADILRIRMSVLFDAATPISAITAVHPIMAMPLANTSEVANGAIMVAPNVIVHLSCPVTVHRMFKAPSRKSCIAFYVDEPQRLIQTLNQRRCMLPVG